MQLVVCVMLTQIRNKVGTSTNMLKVDSIKSTDCCCCSWPALTLLIESSFTMLMMVQPLLQVCNTRHASSWVTLSCLLKQA